MYQPTVAASTATIVPASSALTMKPKLSSCRRSSIGFGESEGLRLMGDVAVAVDVGGLGLADDDELPVARAQHLDRQAVQARQGGRGDHLVDRSAHRPPIREVDDPVEVADERVDVMGDEQHGDALLGADALDEGRDRGLVGQIEAVQWLVEDQHLGTAHEGLGEQQPLLLAAGELADRAVRVAARADEADDFVDARRARCGDARGRGR